MSEITQAFGVGPVFRWRQTTKEGERVHEWTIRPYGIEHALLFSAWLEDRAWAKVERYSGRLDPISYQGRLDAVARLVTADAYDYGKPLYAEAASSVAGRRHLNYLQLAHNPGVTPAVINEVLDGDQGPELIAKLSAANSPPNAEAPEAATPPG